MTALAEPPVVHQPAPKRRKWPFVAVALVLIAAGGVLVATGGSVAPSLDARYLYVHGDGGYEAWLSMDGRHDSQITSGGQTNFVGGCVDGQARMPGNYDGLRLQPCDVMPAYLADAPTDPKAMAAYVEARSNSDEPATWIKTIYDMDVLNYLTPDGRTALFASARYMPGVGVSYGALVAPSGEPIGTMYPTVNRSEMVFMFDSATLNPIETGTDGMTTHISMSQKVVDRVGDR